MLHLLTVEFYLFQILGRQLSATVEDQRTLGPQ